MNEEILTAQEAADFLKVQVGYIYQLKAQKRIPFHYVGKTVRFLKTELIEWLKESTIKN